MKENFEIFDRFCDEKDFEIIAGVAISFENCMVQNCADKFLQYQQYIGQRTPSGKEARFFCWGALFTMSHVVLLAAESNEPLKVYRTMSEASLIGGDVYLTAIEHHYLTVLAARLMENPAFKNQIEKYREEMLYVFEALGKMISDAARQGVHYKNFNIDTTNKNGNYYGLSKPLSAVPSSSSLH